MQVVLIVLWLWQVSGKPPFHIDRKENILTLLNVNLQLPDAPPLAYRSYRIVWFKETRSGYLFVSKYHSILQDTRYILGRTLFLRSGVAAMYGQRIAMTVLSCVVSTPREATSHFDSSRRLVGIDFQTDLGTNVTTHNAPTFKMHVR